MFNRKVAYFNITVKLINKRSELVSKCRHKNRSHLVNYKAIPPDN